MGSVIVRTAVNILDLLATKADRGQTELTTQDLDNVRAPGLYIQSDGAEATVINHYPLEGVAGHLFVESLDEALPERVAQTFTISVGSTTIARRFWRTRGAGVGWSAWVEVGSPGIGVGHFLGKNQYLPGRPLETGAQNIQIAANAAWTSLFRVTETRVAPGIAYSINIPAAAGSKARIILCTWDWSTMTATLRDDYGEVAMDAAGSFTVAKPVGMTDLMKGDYAAIIIPQAAVTFRMLQIADLLYGAQSASGLFNLNSDRANPAFVAVQGSYPASAPASLVFTTAYTHVGAKAALTWMVLS